MKLAWEMITPNYNENINHAGSIRQMT